MIAPTTSPVRLTLAEHDKIRQSGDDALEARRRHFPGRIEATLFRAFVEGCHDLD